MKKGTFMGQAPISRETNRPGYFEVTFSPGKPGVPGELAVFCLAANGFTDAKEAFDKLEIGTYRSCKEITKAQFKEWEDLNLEALGGLPDAD